MRIRAGQGAGSTPPEPAVAAPEPSPCPAHIALALQVGALVVSAVDLPEAITGVCRALPDAVAAAGVVIIAPRLLRVEVLASDSPAMWIGEVQRRAGAGPLFHALRTGRPMVNPDLTRVGPPELAAVAAESGLITSVVVPLVVGERRLGGLQLLGDGRCPVGIGHVDLLQPLVDALTARLVDFLALTAPTRAPGPAPTEPASRDEMAPGPDRSAPRARLTLPPPRAAGRPMTGPPSGDPTDAIPIVAAPRPAPAPDAAPPSQPVRIPSPSTPVDEAAAPVRPSVGDASPVARHRLVDGAEPTEGAEPAGGAAPTGAPASDAPAGAPGPEEGRPGAGRDGGGDGESAAVGWFWAPEPQATATADRAWG